tara:strand:- start:725 stop:1147 length:423 start_codon:yes stop_codon:yes gene_type:complete
MTDQYVIKALYRNDKFIKDLPSHSIYKKFFYRDDFTNDEIILFETILELQKIHRAKEITYTFERLKPFTRMTRRKFESTRKSLEDRKLLVVKRAGFKAPITYRIDVHYIKNNLTKVYDLGKIPKDNLASLHKDIINWFST